MIHIRGQISPVEDSQSIQFKIVCCCLESLRSSLLVRYQLKLQSNLGTTLYTTEKLAVQLRSGQNRRLPRFTTARYHYATQQLNQFVLGN